MQDALYSEKRCFKIALTGFQRFVPNQTEGAASRRKEDVTMKKTTSVKQLRYSLLGLLILAVITGAAGCGKDDGGPEQYSQAALNQLLSCTVQQAEEFDAALAADRSSIEAAADGEAGLVQEDGEMRDYLTKRFGDSMTDACIDDLAMSRAIYKSIALAKDLGTDIEAGAVELAKRSDEQDCYTFSTEIKTSAGDPAAAAQGTISMQKDGTGWKASKITLTMDETFDRKEQLPDAQAEAIIQDFYEGSYEYTSTTYRQVGDQPETVDYQVEGKLISDPYQQYEQVANASEIQGIVEQYWYTQDEKTVHNMKLAAENKSGEWMTFEDGIKGNVMYQKEGLPFEFDREETISGRKVYVYRAEYEEEFVADYSMLPEEDRNGVTEVRLPYIIILDYYIDPQAKEVIRIEMDPSDSARTSEIAHLMVNGSTQEEAEKEVSKNKNLDSARQVIDIKNFNGEITIDAPEDL